MRNVVAVVAAGLGLVVAAPAPALAVQGVTQYGSFSSRSLSGIAAGPDGKVWFTESANPGYVGHIDVDGSNVTEIVGNGPEGLPKDDQPYDIAPGGDGAMWVSFAAGSVGIARVAMDGTVTLPITSGYTSAGKPHGIVWGPDGRVWFTEPSQDVIGALDPATGVVQEYPVATAGSQPEDIAVGPDGNLWYTAWGNNRIGRITTAGVATDWPTPTASSSPTGITAGPDGAMWFTEAVGGVGRITTDGTIEDFAVASLNAPRGIVAGGDDGLWVMSSGGSGRVVRVATDHTTRDITSGLSGNRAPWWGTAGPDGNIWLTQNASNGQLARLSLAPIVKAPVATVLTDTSTRMLTKVRPMAQTTTYYVEYGTTTSYGSMTPYGTLGAELTMQVTPVDLSGLAPETTYHARVVATNNAGTTTGPDLTFTTQATPPPPPSTDTPAEERTAPDAPLVDPGPLAKLPEPTPPALGASVGLKAVDGVVVVRDAAGHPVALDGATTLPTGAVVDTRRGTVELESALDASGHTQKGRFWGGVFQVVQPKDGKGMTQLKLTGGSFTGCPAASTARAARTTASAAVAHRKPRRRLWGSDDHGRFQTHGRGAVATVRGTRWLTEDYCDGTKVTVAKGAVAVRDLKTKKTVVVRAGHSYLAHIKR